MKKQISLKPIASAMLAMGLAQPVLSQVLEEVIVTATKRAESLQDVPISMIAMSGESIREMGVARAEEFAADMPAVTIAQNPIGNFIFIRGIGTPGANQGIEQSVSIFHDGIYMGRHQLSRSPFMDLERVEVLRGPQSILFGKNTIGGAISVISAKPTEEVQGMVSAMYGSYGEKEFTGVFSGPISDTLSGRVAVRGYEMDGYIENVMTGDDGPEREDKTFRGQLRWDTSDTLTTTLKWETSTFDSTQQSTQLGVINPTASSQATYDLNQALVAAATGGDGTESYDDERAVANDGGVLLAQVTGGIFGLIGFPDKEEGSENDMDLGTLTFDWAVGEHELTAITGFAAYEYRDICDCDFAALPLIQVDATEDYEQFSQEFRLTSPVGGAFDYIVGAYYHSSDLKYRSGEAFGATLAFQQLGLLDPNDLPNLSRDYGMDQDQSMWAVFGSITFNLADMTRLTAGLRYFGEEKEVEHFLDKRFTGGWTYTSTGESFGDTAAEYDRFLQSATGSTPSSNGFLTYAQVTETVYGGLLGTFEHDIKRTRKENDFNYQLTVEHDFTADTMVFATISNGTKGGGFDGRYLKDNTADKFEYEEETAQNYEVGIKSYLLDNSMSLNATAFYTTVEDYQVSVFDGATAFFVVNAAEIESKGVEVDVAWAATEQLTVNFAGSYLDNEYSDFPQAPCWTAVPGEPARGDCINAGTPSAFRDASGDTNVFSPELSFNLNLNYRQPIGNTLEARFIVNANYSDDIFVAADLDPIYGHQDSFTKYDARVSLGASDGQWEVALIGKNLTDEITSTGNANDQPLTSGNGFKQTDRLRSYALQGTYHF